MTKAAPRAPRLVGVIHLPPLPGSPRAQGAVLAALEEIEASVRRDVAALVDARFDAVIVENFGDAPFAHGAVAPITIAAMSRFVRAAVVAGGAELQVGVNILRNDARGALAVACATGAAFIRVNVHVGAVVADQGVIEGRAFETLLDRRAWGAEHVAIWADVDVKHAAPLARRPLADEVHDAVDRGLAAAILVTGGATGAPADIAKLAEACAVTRGETPVYVASGATPKSLEAIRDAGANGVIVGSWLRANGRAGGAIDGERAKRFAAELRRVFGAS